MYKHVYLIISIFNELLLYIANHVLLSTFLSALKFKCPERTPGKPALCMGKTVDKIIEEVKSEEDPHQMSKLRLQGSFVCFYNEQSEHYLYFFLRRECYISMFW